MNAFDTNLDESRDEIVQKITTNLENYLLRLPKIIELQHRKIYNYNDRRYFIGGTVEEFDIPVSPHEKVRDLILGVPDFAKRQIFIEKFVTLYTHPANEGEDEWWLYCNQTDIKLLPSFIPTLANAYTQGENYTEVVRQICAQRGTLSDDGEAWVDKHSGYFITYINFDEEGGVYRRGI